MGLFEGQLQQTDPDVAVTHRLTVVLQGEGHLVGTWLVRRAFVVLGRARGLDVVLNEDTILDDGDARGA